MIDLEKLREKTQECYGVVMISESEFIALLDYAAALEKDAERLNWLLTEAQSRLADVLENDDGQAWKEGRKFLEKSDTAMEASNG